MTIKDKVFYSVIGFKDVTKMATFHRDGYVKKGNAERLAKDLISKGYEEVMLRREDVWLRNENNEFSCSSPIERYTKNGIELLEHRKS